MICHNITPKPGFDSFFTLLLQGKIILGGGLIGALWETGGEVLRDTATDAAAPCVSVTNRRRDVGTASDRLRTSWWELRI